MKVVILAGGKGTRIKEESLSKPKPMVEIGGHPILWHIMKTYSYYGHDDFIICCGYKGQMIKQYFLNYYMYKTDTEYKVNKSRKVYFDNGVEPWKIILANTGLNTLTAGRLLRIKEYIGDDEEFLLTYGDGVSDVNIDELIAFHHEHDKIVTITTTQPEGRFGAIKFDEDTGDIEKFKEKARVDQSWINAGFMVMNRKVFDYLGDGDSMLEDAPFEKLAREGQMAAYMHPGFWSPMDNMHDHDFLEKLWKNDKAPWKVWDKEGN